MVQSARGMGRARRMVVAGALALAITGAVAPAAVAEHYEGTVELQGATPVEAAVAFSRLAFPDGALEAALGRDDNFADSLASGVLQNNAPLLLTPTATLAPAAESELKRLGVRTVHILGGHSAVSPAVEQQLLTAGYAVRRHRGATRIDTAIEIAKAIVPSASHMLVARAFASGDDPTQAFADSLAAGAWSASSGNPVLLTESGNLSASTKAYLESAKPTHAYVVGGTSAISDAVVAQIAALGVQTERVSGPTRFDTAIEIAERRGIDDITDTDDVVLLEGQAAGAWAPGFASAAYAAVERAPVLLSSGATLPAPTASYLEGGSREVGLLCAPQLPVEACDAAAKALEKRIAPKVTLDQASVAQYADVTGTATPPEEVLSMTASGCGLTDRQVVVNQDGTFSTRIEGAPGTCTLVFSLTTRNLGDTTKSFALTVTDPIPATNKPELVKVETASTGAAIATVRFVFSEIVRATTYDTANLGSMFTLYGPLGTTASYAGLDAAPGAAPRRDPENNRAVLVDFRRAHYDRATTGAVEVGAAEDLESGPNVPASAPLKLLQLAGARTEENATAEKPDLVSVGSLNSQDLPAGKFRATFTFDSLIDATADPDYVATDFGVVIADGRVIPGEAKAETTGTTRTITFSLDDARTPEGVTCEGEACPTLQQALTGVRRGYVAAHTASGRPLQAVNIGDGLTARADLTAVTLDVAGAKADFTFDEAVTSADFSKFSFYTLNGDTVAPTEAAVVSSNVVRVTAPVSKLLVGASVTDGAVTAASGQSAVSAIGLPQSFAAGEITGPVLVSGRAVLTATDTDSKTWSVTWVFGQDIAAIDPAAMTDLLLLYTRDGMAYGDAATELKNCALAEEKREITCTVDIVNSNEDPTPALVSAVADAVTLADPPTTGDAYGNIEQSVRL